MKPKIYATAELPMPNIDRVATIGLPDAPLAKLGWRARVLRWWAEYKSYVDTPLTDDDRLDLSIW